MPYLLYFVDAFLISLIATPFVRSYSLRKNIVANPGGRNIHKLPTARLGGLAVIISFGIVIGLILTFKPSQLHFVSDKIIGIDKNLFGVILGALVLLGVGLIDDIKGMKPTYKLIGHFIASFIVVLFGVKIAWIHNPLTGVDLVLGNFTYILVPLWIVLVINVVNWMDGADGLASGIGLIASVILFFLSISSEVNQPATAILAIVLAGSLLGFLPYNFNPAKIFLGDIGSMFIGFILAVIAIISGGKFATAALVLGLPILDALWVIFRRLVAGQPVWQADRKHLHHRLLDAGFSQRQSVIFLYAISIFFGLAALENDTKGKLIIFFWVLGSMLLIGAITLSLKIKRTSDDKK